jgi:regulatory protein
MDEKSRKAALELAVRLIAARSHSRHELKEKLEKRGFDSESITRTLERLDQLRLLDDRAYAGSCMTSMARRRPEGKLKSRARLKQKGLSDEIIDEAISGSDQAALCLSAAEKKMRILSGSPELKKKKLIAFLQYRGFDWETIQETVKIVTSDQ